MPIEKDEITIVETPDLEIEDDKKTSDKEKGKNDDANKTFPADYVKELRKENANYRLKEKEAQKKAEDAEKKATELADSLTATKQETDKALSESKRLNSAFEQRVINAELKAAAAAEGLLDMDAFKMADVSKIKITDKGEVTGIKEVLAELKQNKAYLFKEVNTGNKNAGAPPADKNNGEKPVYKTPQELKKAESEFLASLR